MLKLFRMLLIIGFLFWLVLGLLPAGLAIAHPVMNLVFAAIGGLAAILWLPGRPDSQPTHWAIRVGVCAISPAAYLLWAYVFAPLMRLTGHSDSANPSQSWLNWWIGGALCTLWIYLIASRYLSPRIRAVLNRWSTRSVDERNQRTDIRQLQCGSRDVPDFDPWGYIRPDSLFLGLNAKDGQPVHVALPPKHILVSGPSGAGKGVLLQSIAVQCAVAGEAVFYFDPKRDDFGPHPLRHAALANGQKFVYLDLAGPAQMNAFAGATRPQLEELLVAAFGAANKGDAADHYRADDRWAARQLAQLLSDECNLTPAEAFQKFGDIFEKDSPDFHKKLRELATIESLNAHQGLDLRDICENGGVVYIVGSTRNQKLVTAQRLLLVRLIQLAEERDRIASTPRNVCVVLDEFKYHISRTALEALGTARDKGMHLVLAHQSLGDLRDVPVDLTPEAVQGAVMENCRVKVVYRTECPDTTLYFARRSGTVLVDDETRRVARNVGLAETVEAERTIRQAERYLLDENTLLSLPTRHAAVFGLGLPQIIHICPFKTKKTADAIQTQGVAGATLDDMMEVL